MPDPVQIQMPQMGESVTEGTVLEWHKREGEFVNEGETVVEVSTDKIDAEVPAPASGVLTKILKAPDETIEVGGTLAELDPNGTPTNGGDATPATTAQAATAGASDAATTAQGGTAGASGEAAVQANEPAGRSASQPAGKSSRARCCGSTTCSCSACGTGSWTAGGPWSACGIRPSRPTSCSCR